VRAILQHVLGVSTAVASVSTASDDGRFVCDVCQKAYPIRGNHTVLVLCWRV
jgi:uncharacterized protein YbaR (Trm112 family)